MSQNNSTVVIDALMEAMDNMKQLFDSESLVFAIQDRLNKHDASSAAHSKIISAAIAKHVAETHHGGDSTPDTPAAPVPPSAPSIVAPDQIVAGRDASIQLVGDAKTTQFVVTVDGKETVVEAPGGRGTLTLSPKKAGDMAMSVVARDADGNASEAVSRTISAAKINIEPPQITSPVFGEGHINPVASFTVSDMVSDIEDTATGMQLQIAKDAAFTDLVHDETVEGNTVNLAEGVLDGGSTYYVRSRWIGATAGEGPWSAGVRFETEATAQIWSGPILACQVTTGAEGRTWQRLDADYNALPTNPDFDHHAIYANMTEQLIDGQHMIRIPKCFVKREIIATGEFVGKDMRAVSDIALPGYEVHPAFLQDGTGNAVEQLWIAKYIASGSHTTEFCSKPGVPVCNCSPNYFTGFHNKFQSVPGRNQNGVTGFHWWNIHEWSLLQLLCLLEYGSADAVALLMAGRENGDSSTFNIVDGPSALATEWRGFIGLFNYYDQLVEGIKGWKASDYIQFYSTQENKSVYSTIPLSTSSAGSFYNKMVDSSGTGWNAKYLFIGDRSAQATSVDNAAYPSTQNFYRKSDGSALCTVGGSSVSPGQYNKQGLFSIHFIDGSSGSTYSTCRLAKW